MQELGERLKTLRTRKRWTQEQLAEAARRYAPGRALDRALISNYERGVAEPQTWVMWALSQALGVTFEYLIGKQARTMPVPEPELYELVQALNALAPPLRFAFAQLGWDWLRSAEVAVKLANSLPRGTLGQGSAREDLADWAAQWTAADELEAAQEQEETLFDLSGSPEQDADCPRVSDTVPVAAGG